MSNANPLQLLRSNTANKRPDPTALADGRPAVNTNAVSPGLFFKDSAGNLVKVGPVHVGTTAPNASPASGGATGNSLGEQWLDTSGGVYVLKIWDGSAWRSETGTFVDASGDTMTGALVMDNQQQVRFREVTANGTNYIALQAPASVASDKTITLPDVNGTVVTTGDTGTVTSTMIADATIVDADISASAEIAVSKLADGTARQLLQTDAAGTGVEWTSNVDVPGTLDVTGAATFDSTVAVTGALTKSGSNVVTVGDTGTVTSTMILDGTIVNADVNASAAIAGTKISPDFGSQNVTTTGTSTSASFIPTSSAVPTNGVYLPAANSVAISTGGSGRLFVDASGGISTSSTAWQGGAAYQAGGLQIGGSTYAKAILQTNGTIRSEWFFDNADTYLQAKAGIFYITNTTANPIGFYTNGSERLRITSAGLVGVGTSSPLTKLDVRSGVITAGSSSSPDGTEILRGYYSATDGALAVIGTEYSSGGIVIGSAVKPSTSASDAFLSSTTVNVARGAYTIAGNTHKWYIGAVQTVAENSSVSTSEVMRIDSSGRVGIGTTSPGASLDVVAATSGAFAQYVRMRSGNDYAYLGFRSNDGTEDVAQIGVNRTGVGTGHMVFNTSGSEAVRIDSSRRLLVGTSSTSSEAKLLVQGGSTGAGAALHLQRDTTTASAGSTIGYIRFANSADNAGATIVAEGDGTWTAGTSHPTRLVFSTTADGTSSPTERMRISSQGVAQITAVDTNSASLVISANATSGSQYGVLVASANDQNATGTYFFRGVGGPTERFTVRTDGGIANYSANNVNLSDRNAKKDVTPATGTWDCIKEWEIVNYRYKNQPDAADLNLGVIAQQVAESCPEVITVFEEAKDDQPEKLGVKEQQMYWMAIKALQEAQMRIETLEAKVAALESA